MDEWEKAPTAKKVSKTIHRLKYWGKQRELVPQVSKFYSNLGASNISLNPSKCYKE